MPRLFVAIRPPDDVRDALLDLMDGIERARWQDDDQLHLTLAFLGQVDPQSGDDLVERLDAIDRAPFELAIAGVGHFERKGRPSAVWARIAPSDQLSALQRQVAQAARLSGCAMERRKYHPHITLARLDPGSESPARWLAENANLAAGPWEVQSFALYESRLRPGGAQYEPLLQFRLRA